MLYVIVITIGIIMIVYLVVTPNLETNDKVGITMAISTVALVVVTGVYAWHTHKMAEEMREQRIITSRPVIILKPVHEKDIWEGSTKDYFSHFEISNVGNSPAIELESSLTANKHDYSSSIRQTYLRKDDDPVKFRPYNISSLEQNKTYYLICEYQNVFPYDVQKPFYQTCLPFKMRESGEKGKIYIVAGELEFTEVSEEERIDAFGSRSKPK